MTTLGNLTLSTTEDPKLKPKREYTEVSFDLYGVSVDSLLKIAGKRLQITIEVLES